MLDQIFRRRTALVRYLRKRNPDTQQSCGCRFARGGRFRIGDQQGVFDALETALPVAVRPTFTGAIIDSRGT